MRTSAIASAPRGRRTLPLLAALGITAAGIAEGAANDPAAQSADPVEAQEAGPGDAERAEPVGAGIIGREVLSAEGETVGEVVDIAFSRRHGEEVARIRLTGFLGTGERQISLPLSRLSLTPEGEVQTTLSSDQLESIPEVDEEFDEDPEG